LRPGRGVKRAYEIVRAHIPRLTNDRPLAPDIEKIVRAIRGGEFDSLI
jgi:histidine ammonia-lyase